MLTGWRYWKLLDGELWPPFGHPRPGLRYPTSAPWEAGWNVAQCAELQGISELPESRHAPGEGAPARNCHCGINVTPTPEELLEIRAFGPHVERGDVVLGLVEYDGVTHPAGFVSDNPRVADPRGTLRVERARLLRLDVRHLPRDRAEAVSSLLEQRYGVPVVDGHLSELHDALHGVPDEPQDAVVLDVDGTLCDVRSVHRGLPAADWHREALHCPPNPAVVAAACEAHAAGRALLIVTHRQQRYGALTARWLAEHLPVPFAGMYMRNDGDHRSGALVKRELLELIRADGYRVVHAYDDDPAVVDVWRSEGVPVTRVVGFGGFGGQGSDRPAKADRELAELHAALFGFAS